MQAASGLGSGRLSPTHRSCCLPPTRVQRVQRPLRCRCSVVSAETTTSTASAFTSCEKAAAALTDPQQQEQWLQCCKELQDLGFTAADADRYVTRAFGWGTQAFWRGAKVEEAPSVIQVTSALSFLKSLGLSQADLVKVVKAFPEVVGCDVATQLEANCSKLTADWKLTGQVLAKAVVRQPAVLGYNVDCEGSCVGECNRCWARF